MKIIKEKDIASDMIRIPFQNKLVKDYHPGHVYLIQEAKKLGPVCIQLWHPHWEWTGLFMGSPVDIDDLDDYSGMVEWAESQNVDYMVVKDVSETRVLKDYDLKTASIFVPASELVGMDGEKLRQEAKKIMKEEIKIHWKESINLALECHLMAALSGKCTFSKWVESDKDGWHSYAKQHIWTKYGNIQFSLIKHIRDAYDIPWSSKLRGMSIKDRKNFKFRADNEYNLDWMPIKIKEMQWQLENGDIHRISKGR